MLNGKPIEFHIGEGICDSTIADSILRNADSETQYVQFDLHPRDDSPTALLIDALKKQRAIVANFVAINKIETFDVFYMGGKTNVIVSTNPAFKNSSGGNIAADVLHFAEAELTLDKNYIINDDLDEFRWIRKKFCIYFRENKPRINADFWFGLLQPIDKVFYYPMKELRENEIAPDTDICYKCPYKVYVCNQEKLCAEVPMRMTTNKLPKLLQITGIDTRLEDQFAQCGRMFRESHHWKILINQDCPYYAEHFLYHIKHLQQ